MHSKYVASFGWTSTKNEWNAQNATWSCLFGPSISCNLIASVLTIYRVKLTQSTELEQKGFDIRLLSSALSVITRFYYWVVTGKIRVICMMVKTSITTSIIQRRRVGSALADYKVHLYGHNFHCVLYVNREEESRRLVKSLQRQLIEVKREKESEIQVSQVYLQYTHQMYIHTITFKTNEIYLINIKLNDKNQ